MSLLRHASIALLIAALAGCQPETPEALVASAKRYIDAKEYSAAAIQLKNALQKNPNFGEARYLLGVSLVNTGDGVGAEIELSKALANGYPPDRVNPSFARALLLQGKYKLVIDTLANSPAATPRAAAELSTTVGQARLALTDREAASAAFARALDLDPTYAPALFGLASVKAGRGDLNGAIALIDDSLKSDPSYVDALRARGDILAAQGKRDLALAAYRKALEAKNSDIASHAHIVMLLAGEGKLDDAEKQLQTLQALAPNPEQTSYMKAFIAYRRHDLASARAAIQRSLQTYADSVGGLLLAATIEFELKSYETSEEYIRRALKIAPNDPLTQRFLVSSYLARGDNERALKALPALLKLDGGNPTTLEIAGGVYLQNGAAAEAARYFEKAVAIDPGSGRNRTGLALSNLALRNTDEALRQLNEAAQLDTDIRADMALIATSLARKQFDQALAAIDRLDKKRPGKALSANLRGLALLGKGDRAAARSSFIQAVTLEPSFFPAVSNLVALDVRDGKLDAAIARMRTFAAANPASTQPWLAIAELQARSKAKPEVIAESLAKAVAANPGDVASRRALIAHYLVVREPTKAVAVAQDALSAVRDGRAELFDIAGRAFEAAGVLNQARSTYLQWAQLQPPSPSPWVRLADIDVASGDPQAALKNLRKAIEIRPDWVEAQWRIVAIDASTNKLSEALVVAREVQRQRPNEPVGYMLEGDVQARRKAWKEAAAVYRAGLAQSDSPHIATRLHATLRSAQLSKDADRFAGDWLSKHPNDRIVRLYLAQSAGAARDYATAVRYYRELVELEPNNALYLNNLASAAGRTNDPQALSFAEKAAALAPDNASILDTLGGLLVEKGDTTRGIEMLRKAVTLAPERPELRLNFAKGLLAGGDKASARKELQELSRLGDKFPAQAEVERLVKTM